MKPQLKSSPAARELIQRFEPYRELAAQGSDGRWSVGFGHRAAARDGVRVSRDDASLLLIYDVMQAESVIDEMFPTPLPKMQRDALTSFVHDVGTSAFRNSDVARYLFEGRVEAAAEALAGYGEGRAERREAESAMLLAGLDEALASAAPARKPALVDLMIKVEHPGEEPRPADIPLRPRPALPDSLMPPPPPSVLTRQAAARREAEGEIARILATVGAMPSDVEAPEAETPAEAAAPVAEPVIEPIVEPVPEAEITPQAYAEPESPEDDAIAIAGDSLGETEAEPEPEAAPEAEAEPEAEVEIEPAAAPDGPERAAHAAANAAPVSAQVIARMSQEIAHVQTAVTGRAESPVAAPADGQALPEGVSLGYVFTGTMRAGLAPIDVDDMPGSAPAIASEPELTAIRSGDEPEAASADTVTDTDTDPAEALIEDAQAAGPEIEATADEEAEPVADLVPAAAAIVARTLAGVGNGTPPPHPADAHAPSEGAVGDIAGEAAQEGARPDSNPIAHIDELAGAPGAATVDSDEDDPFSPGDLVGSTDMFVDSKPVEVRKEEGGWGFAATLIAGLVVTGAGILDIYGDWPRVWVDRDPTWGVLAAVAGGFLVVTASWMLWSVLAAKRRRKRTG
jgi:GH24 family phage-related lysozyme (muramidase)